MTEPVEPLTSEPRPQVNVEILRCNGCGALAVSIADTRLTAHKCAGSWTTLLTESASVSEIVDAIAADSSQAGVTPSEAGDDSRLVTVCAECKTASCWHGKFMCDKAKFADVMQMPVSELRELGREHPDNWREP